MTMEEIRKYQLAQLELIKAMDEICTELNLTYYLIGGTLLGAVRHGGFIPWDPDIDIAMPREDYEKIRTYFVRNNNDRYIYQHYSTEKNHISPHALLRIKGSQVIFKSRKTRVKLTCDGIYLDIFPLDNAPETGKLQNKQMKKIRRIRAIIALKAAYIYKENSALKRFVKYAISTLLLPISFASLNRILDNTMKKYNNPSASTFVSMASHYSYKKQLMPKEVYGLPQKICFEGLSLSAPADTHGYLTRIFGNYMELPPEDQRVDILNMFEKIEYATKDGVK